ncbi:MAG: hypothetical protein AAB638_00720 [Patescibacteria group bacterium]
MKKVVVFILMCAGLVSNAQAVLTFKNYYVCETEADRSTSWGGGNGFYCHTNDTNKNWKLVGGAWFEIPYTTTQISPIEIADKHNDGYFLPITGVIIGNGITTMTGVSGTALQYLRRNAGNTDYEFATISGGGDMLKSENLSGLANYTTARTNLSLENVTNESKATMFSSPTFTGTVSGVTATHVGLGNVTNESKATMFTNSTFTGTFNVADGAIADADLANTILPKLTTDANTIYGTTDIGNSGAIPVMNLIIQDANYTLTSTTSEQKLFNVSANGRLTLETGTYLFECVSSISSLSATSGNGAFDILGAGGATIGTVLYHSVGVDGNTATAATQTGSTMIQGQSPASMQTAGTGTTWNFRLKGTFRVTVAGTIVPSVSLVTAAAGVVRAGSYFSCYRIGSSSLTSIGKWD